MAATAAGAGDFSFAIALASRCRLAAEGFALAPANDLRQSRRCGVRAADARGCVYALTELADRVRCGGDPVAALTLAAPVEARPANAVRSIARAFVSEVEDKPWFYDRGFWRDYLTALATNRFNRFSLTFGLGYDFPRDVVGDYLHFPYPYLLDVPGYHVRAVPLEMAKRDRNLETLPLHRGGDGAARAGIPTRPLDACLRVDGQPARPSPHRRPDARRPTPPYCRDALARCCRSCPAIQGLTLRVHGESGIPEGSYDFWRTVFQGIVQRGPADRDRHACQGHGQQDDRRRGETGMPVKISPKFWAEHMGMPYHQAAIRELEMPRAGHENDPVFA